MNSNWFKLAMKITKVEYGKNLLLKGVPIIFNKGGAKLKIGENVTIKSSFLSNLVGLYSRTIIVTRAPGAEIEIGDNSGMVIDCTLPSNVKIGDNVMMGPKCFFLAFNHAYKDKSKSIQSQGYTDKKIIRIGNDVWIGREVLFTPGRIVKDGTVIAARTVVCKDFASYSVIGGNPARLIATRE